jgi:hypothetical protein
MIRHETKEAAEAAIKNRDLQDVYAAVFYGPGPAKAFKLPGAGWYVWNRCTKRVAE